MISISRDEFEDLVDRAVHTLPSTYVKQITNIAFIVEDYPSLEQRHKLMLRPYQSLYGLYEGVPLPERQGRTKLIPDKITIFQKVIESSCNSMDDLYKLIGNTVWHEVAHYFGLDHEMIRNLENKPQR
jgi:predicted Zn-dependent protease with MMP-like domain